MACRCKRHTRKGEQEIWDSGAATKQYNGKSVINSLAHQGILIRSRSMRGIAEEAPGAYKDVSEVVEATHHADLAKKVAKLTPLVCIKG